MTVQSPPFARRVRLYALALLGCLAAAGCGGVSDPPAGTQPTITPTTENFSGTLQKSGAVVFTFNVAYPDTSVTATLTTLSPQTDIALGMSLGVFDGVACSGGVTNTAAKVNTVLTGVAAGGTYCVEVYDPGNVTSTENLAVSVVHY